MGDHTEEVITRFRPPGFLFTISQQWGHTGGRGEEGGEVKKFRCIECGYVCEAEGPPDFCPECYAPGGAFIEVEGAEAP